jgi:hypothetical protein
MVMQFFEFLTGLMTATIGGTAVVGQHVVYGGNALQAFLIALAQHGTFLWGS